MPREAMGGGNNSPVMPELSGKMFVLWRLMRQMRMPGNGADVRFAIFSWLSIEVASLTPIYNSFHRSPCSMLNPYQKIVIVSNYTQTLDLIGRMCKENNWGFCRLDGSISMKKRQKMVRFGSWFSLP